LFQVDLHLWIDVLNAIDSRMFSLVAKLSAMGMILNDPDIKRILDDRDFYSSAGYEGLDATDIEPRALIDETLALLSWTQAVLAHGVNKADYGSAEVSRPS
jgi:hypothetical protein